MPKYKIVVNATVEVDEDNYDEGLTPEEMLQVEKDNIKGEGIVDFMYYTDKIDYTIELVTE